MAFQAFKATLRASRAYPTLVASVQAGGLMAFGDMISQNVFEKEKKYDYIRTLRFGSMGFFFVGPLLRVWYGFLESRVVLKPAALATFAKVAADQLFMAPVFLANFIVLNSSLQGNSWKKAKEDLSSTYYDVLLSNYQLWPGVQLVNFGVIPPSYRVLFVQSVAVSWNTYLSWKTNANKK